MKISIITTAYNAEKYIEETIESVLSQRGDFEIEYIVVDAKSKDSTLEIINKYKTLVEGGNFSRLNLGITMHVISEKDNGMYDGISKGFKLITGDVVAYLNADDFYTPNAFSCVCEIFKNFPQINWLTGRANSYNSKGHSWESILPAHFHRKYIRKGFYGKYMPVIQQESTFWRKELLKIVNLEEFKKQKFAGDFYLWHSFSKENDLYIINSNLSGFRFSEDQKSLDRDSYSKEFDMINENYKPNFAEKLIISKLKQTRRLSDKKKLQRNQNILRFDLGKNTWTLG